MKAILSDVLLINLEELTLCKIELLYSKFVILFYNSELVKNEFNVVIIDCGEFTVEFLFRPFTESPAIEMSRFCCPLPYLWRL